VSTTPTKKIKSALRQALKSNFWERGWRPKQGDPGTFLAPDFVVAAPLELHCRIDMDSDTYGGARFTARASICAAEVTELLLTFDWSSMPSMLTRWGEEGLRLGLSIAGNTAGGLVDPLGNYQRWVVRVDSELNAAVTDFFRMVDGPLLAWASELNDVSRLLAALATEENNRRLDSVSVRTLATLALIHDRPDLAREVVASYQLPGLGDDTDRLARFERELAARFPAYGPLQKPAPRN
jgi:hypothetical protein